MNTKKPFFCSLLFVFLISISSLINAQVTNLSINGSSSNFIGTQDIGVQWQYDVPVGSTTKVELWLHLGGSTFIDPSSDKSIFGAFYQTDGDMEGRNGPPDFDGLQNGHVVMNIPTIFLAPGKYIMKFTNNNQTVEISGTILPMAAPAYTISGKYTPHAGATAQNIMLRAVNKNNDMCQAYGLTDASGNYVINMSAAYAGGAIQVSIQDNITPYVASPADTTVTLTQSFTGINFFAVAPAAKIVGYLKGDDSKAIANMRVRCYAQNTNGDNRIECYTGSDGYFALGFTNSQINTYPLWRLECDDDLSPNYVSPQTGDISLHAGDSLRIDLIAFKATDSIKGTVLLDGVPCVGQKLWVEGYVPDTCRVGTYSDPTTGKFTLYVSKKYPGYYLSMGDLPSNYAFDWYSTNRYSAGTMNAVVKVITVSWTKQTTPVNDSLFTVFFINSQQGWAGGVNGKLIATTDGGTTWTLQTTNTTAAILDVKFANATTGWFTARGGIIKKTTNGGAAWTSQNSGVTNNIYVLQVIDANTSFASAENYILKTTNGGTSWSKQSTPNSENVYGISMLSATTGYCVGYSGNLYNTTDGGSTWNYVVNTNCYNASRLYMNASGYGYITAFQNFISRTTDFGASWSGNNTYGSQIYGLAINGNDRLWVVGQNNNIFSSTNGGLSWINQPVNVNNNPSLYAVFFVDANNGWAVGDNGLILHTINGGMVGVEDEQALTKAYTFTLAQNYPNPFNPGTVIRYTVPQSGSAIQHVTLKVYNMLGQLVAVLVDANMPYGNFTAAFNGHNLASGIYLYTLQIGEQSVTKKMILMK